MAISVRHAVEPMTDQRIAEQIAEKPAVYSGPIWTIGASSASPACPAHRARRHGCRRSISFPIQIRLRRWIDRHAVRHLTEELLERGSPDEIKNPSLGSFWRTVTHRLHGRL